LNQIIHIIAFAVNSLLEEFIAYYSDYIKNNNQKKVSFLDTLLSKKGAELKRLKDQLEEYKVKNQNSKYKC
jgi:hypothetical protein